MHLITPAGTWFNIICKARLIGVNTYGEKDMLLANSEHRSSENFGMFFRCSPRLEFLNLASRRDPGSNVNIQFKLSFQSLIMDWTAPSSGLSCCAVEETSQL